MIRFLIPMLLFSNLAFAGISVCYNPDNTMKDFSLRGDQVQGCDYYQAGAKYDQVRTLLKTVERRYIKKLGSDPVEMSPAEKVAVDDALAATNETQYRTQQKGQFNGAQGVYLRAMVDILIKELNTLRQWDESFKAQVALASNLADLKARVAALPTMPDRTLLQAKNAIQADIDSKSVDE